MADSLQVLPILCNDPAGRDGDEEMEFPTSRLPFNRFSASEKSFNKLLARSLTSNDGSSSTRRLTVDTRLGCLLILEGVGDASKKVFMSLSRFKRTTALGCEDSRSNKRRKRLAWLESLLHRFEDSRSI